MFNRIKRIPNLKIMMHKKKTEIIIQNYVIKL